jgi:hypothetical protein
MALPIRYILPAFVLGSIAACSGTKEDALGRGEQGISRTPIDYPEENEPIVRPRRDSGVEDTSTGTTFPKLPDDIALLDPVTRPGHVVRARSL